MKKIVALVLSLVLALSLATVAFAAVPQWTLNNSGVNLVDIFATTDQKTGEDVMTYHPAKAPVLNKDGSLKVPGNIAYYTFENTAGLFIMSEKYTKAASFAVKAHTASAIATDTTFAGGTKGQTTPDQLYFMIEVTAVTYGTTGSAFTAWGTKCGQYAEPADADTVAYVKTAAGQVYATLATATDADASLNVLVDGVVFTVVGDPLTTIQHKWVPCEYDKTGAVTAYKCSVCGTVGKVVISPYDPAAQGHTVERLPDLADGTPQFVYFDYTVPAVAGAADASKDGVKSAKTFDAGIALYAGMALASVAGSAAVIGKKKEF